MAKEQKKTPQGSMNLAGLDEEYDFDDEVTNEAQLQVLREHVIPDRPPVRVILKVSGKKLDTSLSGHWSWSDVEWVDELLGECEEWVENGYLREKHGVVTMKIKVSQYRGGRPYKRGNVCQASNFLEVVERIAMQCQNDYLWCKRDDEDLIDYIESDYDDDEDDEDGISIMERVSSGKLLLGVFAALSQEVQTHVQKGGRRDVMEYAKLPVVHGAMRDEMVLRAVRTFTGSDSLSEAMKTMGAMAADMAQEGQPVPDDMDIDLSGLDDVDMDDL